MDEIVTTVNFGERLGRFSRQMSVEKVQNGYEVRASFQVITEFLDDGVVRKHYGAESRTFVYYTIDEVQHFTQKYMDCDDSDLKTLVSADEEEGQD